MKQEYKLKKVVDFFNLTENETELLDQLKEEKAPLFIKIISLIAGFFVNLCFVGFLFITNLIETPEVILIIGLLLFSITVWLSRKNLSETINVAIISFFATGISLFVYGYMDINPNIYIEFPLILLGVLGVILTKNNIIQFLNFILIFGSLIVFGYEITSVLFLSIFLIIITFSCSYLFVYEGTTIIKNTYLKKIYRPLLLSLFLTTIYLASANAPIIYFYQDTFEYHNLLTHIVNVSCAICILFILIKIQYKFQIANQPKVFLFYLIVTIILYLISNSTLLLYGILFLLITYYSNNSIPLVISFLLFLYGLFLFYYDMNLSLLYKSLLLISTGILFLILFLFTKKQLSHEEL